MIAGPRYYAALAGRLRWDPESLDLASDAKAWPALDGARRARMTRLLAGFCVAEYRVADELAPFEPAAGDPALAATFAAQRADECRHARLFDRIAELILCAPGGDPVARREWVRPLAPEPLLELFERRLPETAFALSLGRIGLADGVALYHLILEGVVLSAGQHALLAELAEAAMPELRRAIELVERDERWHVGFGLRCMLASRAEPAMVAALLGEARTAVEAWGPLVPEEIRARVLAQHGRRLAAIGLLPAPRAHAAGSRAG